MSTIFDEDGAALSTISTAIEDNEALTCRDQGTLLTLQSTSQQISYIENIFKELQLTSPVVTVHESSVVRPASPAESDLDEGGAELKPTLTTNCGTVSTPEIVTLPIRPCTKIEPVARIKQVIAHFSERDISGVATSQDGPQTELENRLHDRGSSQIAIPLFQDETLQTKPKKKAHRSKRGGVNHRSVGDERVLPMLPLLPQRPSLKFLPETTRETLERKLGYMFENPDFLVRRLRN